MRSEYTYVDPGTGFVCTKVDDHPGMETRWVFEELRLPGEPLGKVIEIRFNDRDKENKTPD